MTTLVVLNFLFFNEVSAFKPLDETFIASRKELSLGEIFYLEVKNFRNVLIEKAKSKENIKSLENSILESEINTLLRASKNYLETKGLYKDLVDELDENEKDTRIIQVALITLAEEKEIDKTLNIESNYSVERDETLAQIGACLGSALGFGAIGTAGLHLLIG